MFARRILLAGLAGLLCVVAATGAARATTVVPVPEQALIDQSVAIVIGEVQRIESHWDPARQQVFTLVTIGLHEVLKGAVGGSELTLKQTGGRVGWLSSWVQGSVEFHRGEWVLLFLRTNADGTLRVAHLFQGKLSIVLDPATAETVALRLPPEGVRVLGGTAAIRERLELIRARIRARVLARGTTSASAPAVMHATAPATAPGEMRDDFTYLGPPSRWFEPDTATPIPMSMNSSGEPLASGLGFSQVRSGYGAWNAVTGSSARFSDAGFTSAAGFVFDGVNAVSFRDPLGQMDPPSGCGGTLAMGGYHRTDETRTVNGTTYFRIIEGDVVFNDGWDGCEFYENAANFAEVATHELGHVLGFGHTTESDSIMSAFVHFDGRGARLGADDMAGVRFVYPAATTSVSLAVVRQGTGSGSVSSSPAGISCGSDCSENVAPGTTVTLTATPASGSTFGGWSGGGCSGTAPTCGVTVNTSTTVTATFTPSGSGGLTASFRHPASGATVKGLQSIGIAMNKWGVAKALTLSVDERVILTGTTTATTYWYSWDSRTVGDGAHTLTLVVTDSGGSATASLPIRTANGGAPPPPPPPPPPALAASFTAPGSGATIGGTTTVGMASSGGAGGSRTFKLDVGTATLSTQSGTGTTASYAWDTRTVANGSYTLKVTVTDAAGAVATATRTVTVSNGSTPSPSFTASFTHPAEGATTWGMQSIGMSTTAAWGTSKTFTLAVDGRVVTRYTSTSTTLWSSWDTRTVANGSHTLTLTVTNGAGSATATRTITVRN